MKPKKKSSKIPSKTQAIQKAEQQALVLKTLQKEAITPKNELFHDRNEAWARIEIDGHCENMPLKGERFRLLLTRRMRDELGYMPKKALVNDVLNEFSGTALFDGPEYPIALRVAEHDGDIYIDLANEDWQVVRVTAKGWRVVQDVPVRFRRPHGMRPLPVPVHGGDVNDLFTVLNVPRREDQILILSWLVAALRPRGPYPLLVMSGQQGSAKTTAQRFLRTLVDPATAPLGFTPHDDRDLMVAAQHSRVLAFDNLIKISDRLSKALCQLSAGEAGFATRQLYTDAGQVIFDSGQRPMMFNGIGQGAGRDDLLDRMLLFTMPKIGSKERMAAGSIEKTFQKLAPSIFGALLDAVSAALRDESKVSFTSLPRMADFAIWSVAASSALGFTQAEFTEAYDNNRRELRLVAIEGSITAVEVISWFNRPPAGVSNARNEWQGTHKALLIELRQYGTPTGLPNTATGLAKELARVEPNLIEAGVVLTHLKREGGTGSRLIRLSRNAPAPIVPSKESHPEIANSNKEIAGSQKEESKAAVQ